MSSNFDRRLRVQGLTFSSHINAWTLYQAGKRLNVLIRSTDASPFFPMPIDNVESNDRWLLFTEEASLCKALGGELRGRFHPHSFPIELLDDKLAFSRWLQQQNDLTPSPCHSVLEDSLSLSFPILLKARHSWFLGKKLPRGWVCRNQHDLNSAMAKLSSQGLSAECFFLQEWLGDNPMRLLSVCGFFDAESPERNLSCVVERLAGYESGPSCSSIVATIDDDWNLTRRAFDILARLRFVGPFEMEFILSQDRLVVLELNPRFWMQHALFMADGNGLVKRYFALDTQSDRLQNTIGKWLWVDGMFLIRSLVKLNFGLLGILRAKWQEGYKLLIWPSLDVAFAMLIKKAIYKLRGISMSTV